MTIYAPSDFASVIVPADDEHRGCGQAHARPSGPDGLPVHPWALSCADGCEEWLIANDDRWSKSVRDIPPTYDERLDGERLDRIGSQQKDSLLVLAMSRMAGLTQADIPPALTRMLSGLPAHVPGIIMCANGHDNTPGSRFCRECGSQMSRPAAAGELLPGASA
jgi:hypothetical protein